MCKVDLSEACIKFSTKYCKVKSISPCYCRVMSIKLRIKLKSPCYCRVMSIKLRFKLKTDEQLQVVNMARYNTISLFYKLLLIHHFPNKTFVLKMKANICNKNLKGAKISIFKIYSKLSYIDANQIMLQISRGLSYLISSNIMHIL